MASCEWLSSLIVVVFTIFLVTLCTALLLSKKVRSWSYAYIISLTPRVYNREMDKHKRRLFSNLSERSVEREILEIGAGSGANFQYFPPESLLTFVEPNPDFEKYLRQNAKANPHLALKSVIVAMAENMTEVADDSMDDVVSTLVLCSVRDPTAVFNEVRRVLKPGGTFYFLEQVRGEPGSWTNSFQTVFDPLLQLFYGGCSVKDSTWEDLRKAGFSRVEWERFSGPKFWWIFAPHVMGTAVK
ncbi:thiol S-methyltransferase TMT1A-like [Branchiostoma lanceolatum]|uniref:thiol S-methyltransferase TMT1A-like n=1 Tax=Branchiostoma lanceolatum TaxID=7740 RepID=UPI0034521CF0